MTVLLSGLWLPLEAKLPRRLPLGTNWTRPDTDWPLMVRGTQGSYLRVCVCKIEIKYLLSRAACKMKGDRLDQRLEHSVAVQAASRVLPAASMTHPYIVLSYTEELTCISSKVLQVTRCYF